MEAVSLDLIKVLHEVVGVAKEAGALLKELSLRPLKADTKATSIDLVTEADRKTEALIVSHLRQLYPEHVLVGEEGGQYDHADAEGRYRWYIDPLDGTTNFAHGIPHFSVSLALTNGNGWPILGVIYDPMRDECFAAAQGMGAKLNGRSIHVSSVPTLSGAVLASGFPYDKWYEDDNNAEEWGDFVSRTSGERRFGSAALDLAYVAAGRFDGYWEQKVKPWDVYAGIVLVIEAGGLVSDYNGKQEWLGGSPIRLVASNGLLQAQIIDVLHLGKHAPRF